MITVRDMVKNDELSTPLEAVTPLLPFLHVFSAWSTEFPKIWEMCPGKAVMAEHLKDQGYDVYYRLLDGLKWEAPEYDLIVTNPPWSKKHLFLERCVKLNKPFALLLPVRTLGVRRCQIWMNDCDFLFLPKRIDYTGGNSPYEASLWVTRYLLPGRVIFASPESENDI